MRSPRVPPRIFRRNLGKFCRNLRGLPRESCDRQTNKSRKKGPSGARFSFENRRGPKKAYVLDFLFANTSAKKKKKKKKTKKDEEEEEEDEAEEKEESSGCMLNCWFFI